MKLRLAGRHRRRSGTQKMKARKPLKRTLVSRKALKSHELEIRRLLERLTSVERSSPAAPVRVRRKLQAKAESYFALIYARARALVLRERFAAAQRLLMVIVRFKG